MEYIDLVKDYIYEITWHAEAESALNSRKKFSKNTWYFCYTGYSLICKMEEELAQSHIPWYIYLQFKDMCSFSKGRNINGEEYISIPNPVDYSADTKIVFDKVVPYASKQIIDAITN